MPEKQKGKIPLLPGIIFLVLFTAILTYIAMPRLDMPVKGQNAMAAKSLLRVIAAYSESYRATNGSYPESMDALLSGKPPYSDKDYCQQGSRGYRFDCSFSKDGYLFKAIPIEEMKTREDKVFTIKTGAILGGN